MENGLEKKRLKPGNPGRSLQASRWEVERRKLEVLGSETQEIFQRHSLQDVITGWEWKLGRRRWLWGKHEGGRRGRQQQGLC